LIFGPTKGQIYIFLAQN